MNERCSSVVLCASALWLFWRIGGRRLRATMRFYERSDETISAKCFTGDDLRRVHTAHREFFFQSFFFRRVALGAALSGTNKSKLIGSD